MSDDRPPLKVHHGQYPAFSAEEMMEHLLGAPCSAIGPTFLGMQPTVESLEFVKSGELRDRLELWISSDDEALVCHVVLKGPFLARMMSLPPGSPPGPYFCERLREIYDARTGRLIVVGSAARPRPGD
jgi:hypothetical protein